MTCMSTPHACMWCGSRGRSARDSDLHQRVEHDVGRHQDACVGEGTCLAVRRISAHPCDQVASLARNPTSVCVGTELVKPEPVSSSLVWLDCRACTHGKNDMSDGRAPLRRATRAGWTAAPSPSHIGGCALRSGSAAAGRARAQSRLSRLRAARQQP